MVMGFSFGFNLLYYALRFVIGLKARATYSTNQMQNQL